MQNDLIGGITPGHCQVGSAYLTQARCGKYKHLMKKKFYAIHTDALTLYGQQKLLSHLETSLIL